MGGNRWDGVRRGVNPLNKVFPMTMNKEDKDYLYELSVRMNLSMRKTFHAILEEYKKEKE